MAYFSEADGKALAARLSAMREPVRLVFFAQTFGCETCDLTRRVLTDVAIANPLLSLEEFNLVLDTAQATTYGIDRAPAVAVIGERDHGIRFYGAPEGYELASLLEAIQTVSTRDSRLSAESRRRVAALTSPLRLQVFSTPT